MTASTELTLAGARDAAALPLFEGLPPAELHRLLAAARWKRTRSGELLFRQGDEAEGLVIVRTGAGEIFRAGEERWGERLGEFQAGDVLAIASTLTVQPHLASARALVATESLLVSRWEVRRLCRREPEIALRLRAQMEDRLARLVRRLAWIAARNAPVPAPELGLERSA